MPRNGAQWEDSDSTDDSGLRTNRRSYLKYAGAAVASVPLLTGQGSAAVTRRGIQFNRVVDMVNDAGCDPSGGRPCDGNLQRAAGNNTLLRFPAGTYRFTEMTSLVGLTNFGIVGEGDVTFTVPANFNEKLVVADDGTGLLVENITIDQSAPGATPELNLGAADDLHVHDVTFVGQGIHPDTGLRSAPGHNPDVEGALSVSVHSSNGTGVVENFVAHNAGFMGAYTRTGIWVGRKHRGTVTLRECNVEGFPGNGVYASRTPGTVHVEGGLYRNNDVSQVRIGSPGSYVAGATIEVDPNAGRSPNPQQMINGLGMMIESGQRGAGGATVEDCDITIAPNANSNGGISVFENHGSVTIRDTRIRTDTTRPHAYGIRAKTPDGGSLYNAPSGATNVTISNVSLTGSAPGGIGMLIEGRPDSTIEGCCIQQDGASRIGILLDSCSGTRVANSTINATQQAILLRGTNANVTGISRSGTCPAPTAAAGSAPSNVPTGDTTSGSANTDSDTGSAGGSSSGSSSDGSSSGGSSSGGSSSSSSSSGGSSSGGSSGSSSYDFSRLTLPERFLGNSGSDGGSTPTASGDTSGEELVVSGSPAPRTVSEYEIDADGGLRPAADFDNDASITGDGAVGAVANYQDSYAYEGEGFSLTLDDEVTLKLDEDAGTITVLGEDDDVVTDYSIEVSGQLEPTDSVTEEDAVSGDTAEGLIADWRDEYEYTGELRSATLGEDVSITIE